MSRIVRNVEQLFAAAAFAEEGEQESARTLLRGDRSIALVIDGGHDAARSVRFAANAAARNNARLDILTFGGTSAGHGDGTLSRDLGRMAIHASGPVRVVPCAGPVRKALEDHVRREKNLLFLVMDPASQVAGSTLSANAPARLAEALGRPVVQVAGERRQDNDRQKIKEKNMALTAARRKPVGKMLVLGLISVALYALLLTSQDLVSGTFGKGGWYALLPIATAFVFSFVHGSFTSDFWTVLGIEAAKKKKEVK